MWQTIKIAVSMWWSLVAVQWRMVFGVWRVMKMRRPLITIFGGAQLAKDDPYAHQAYLLGQLFIQQNISVLTGGGPGIMDAVSYGAASQGGGVTQIMGIGVRGLEETHSSYAKNYIAMEHFFERKWLLTRFSSAFVVFPGGFGTFDELSEVITLIMTKKMERVPIVLIGKEYWTPFITWLHDELFVGHKLIETDYAKLFTITDDLQEALQLVCAECNLVPKTKARAL